MKNLLLLHHRYTPDDQVIWSVAIRRGWSTQRTDKHRVKEHTEGYDFVRYYGNTLHAAQLPATDLPFNFSEIDYSVLAKVPHLTRRRIDYIHYKNLTQPLKQTAFIKPARDKWFEAKVYKEGDVIPGSPLADDDIYVSEITKFTDEVRCFVLNGEIHTCSLYRIGNQVWDTTGLPSDAINFESRVKDTPLPQYVKELCTQYSLPKGVVIDFGLQLDGTWALIEFNEAWACGLYYCDYHKCFDVIIESQTNKQT